jgi:putative component of toxin-antitoxin plasmid stabilization module
MGVRVFYYVRKGRTILILLCSAVVGGAKD